MDMNIIKAINPLIHKYRREFLSFCQIVEKIYIYGLGDIAEYFYEYCKEEDIRIDGVIVFKGAEQTKFHDLPVCDLEYLPNEKSVGVILAAPAQFQCDLFADLKNIAFKGIVYEQKHLHATRYSGPLEDWSCLLPFRYVGKGKSYFSEYRDLDELGIKYRTDKCSELHNYLDKYEFFCVHGKIKISPCSNLAFFGEAAY